MARILLGDNFADIRGSQGGTVYARNKFGNYRRNKTTPVNPNTARQQDVRGFLAQVSQYYSEHLTEENRRGWEVFAANTAFRNNFNQTIHMSAIQVFVQANCLRKRAGLAIVDAPPPTAGACQQIVMNTPDFTAHSADQKVYIFQASALDGWDNTLDDDYCLIYAGLPKDKNVMFFNGPWRYKYALPGAVTDGITFPWSFTYPYQFQTGQKLFIKTRHLDPNSKVSGATQISITAVL